jgi:acetoin utilization protein AcuB
MQAEDIMTEPVTFIAPNQPVSEALEVLAGIEARHLPVLEEGELVGMLSDRDLRSLGLYDFRDLRGLERLEALIRTPVSRVMSAGVQAVERSTDVREVVERMLDEKVGALPVVDPHTREVVGIISYVDVLRVASDLFVD